MGRAKKHIYFNTLSSQDTWFSGGGVGNWCFQKKMEQRNKKKEKKNGAAK